MILQPARRARHYFHALRPSLQIVAVGHSGIGELNGHISRAESIALEILLIVNVNNTHDFMTTAAGYLFDHLAHFAVAD